MTFKFHFKISLIQILIFWNLSHSTYSVNKIIDTTLSQQYCSIKLWMIDNKLIIVMGPRALTKTSQLNIIVKLLWKCYACNITLIPLLFILMSNRFLILFQNHIHYIYFVPIYSHDPKQILNSISKLPIPFTLPLFIPMIPIGFLIPFQKLPWVPSLPLFSAYLFPWSKLFFFIFFFNSISKIPSFYLFRAYLFSWSQSDF